MSTPPLLEQVPGQRYYDAAFNDIIGNFPGFVPVSESAGSPVERGTFNVAIGGAGVIIDAPTARESQEVARYREKMEREAYIDGYLTNGIIISDIPESERTPRQWWRFGRKAPESQTTTVNTNRAGSMLAATGFDHGSAFSEATLSNYKTHQITETCNGELLNTAFGGLNNQPNAKHGSEQAVKLTYEVIRDDNQPLRLTMVLPDTKARELFQRANADPSIMRDMLERHIITQTGNGDQRASRNHWLNRLRPSHWRPAGEPQQGKLALHKSGGLSTVKAFS